MALRTVFDAPVPEYGFDEIDHLLKHLLKQCLFLLKHSLVRPNSLKGAPDAVPGAPPAARRSERGKWGRHGWGHGKFHVF